MSQSGVQHPQPEVSPPNPMYKGVIIQRLIGDLKESTGLPIGVRPGSATTRAAAARPPTALDHVSLWFTDNKDTAETYCEQSTSDAVVLEIDVTGVPVYKSGMNYYTTQPIPWNQVWYLKEDGSRGALQHNQTTFPDAKLYND